MEWQNLVRSSAKACLVALRTGDGHVGSSQHEASVLVLGDGERRAMKVLHGMAILATVQVGSRGELLAMRILMAIRACGELHFVCGVSLPAGVWHLSQATAACLPSSGYFDVACSFTPASEVSSPSTFVALRTLSSPERV